VCAWLLRIRPSATGSVPDYQSAQATETAPGQLFRSHTKFGLPDDELLAAELARLEIDAVAGHRFLDRLAAGWAPGKSSPSGRPSLGYESRAWPSMRRTRELDPCLSQVTKSLDSTPSRRQDFSPFPPEMRSEVSQRQRCSRRSNGLDRRTTASVAAQHVSWCRPLGEELLPLTRSSFKIN